MLRHSGEGGKIDHNHSYHKYLASPTIEMINRGEYTGVTGKLVSGDCLEGELRNTTKGLGGSDVVTPASSIY